MPQLGLLFCEPRLGWFRLVIIARASLLALKIDENVMGTVRQAPVLSFAGTIRGHELDISPPPDQGSCATELGCCRVQHHESPKSGKPDLGGAFADPSPKAAPASPAQLSTLPQGRVGRSLQR